MKHAGSIHFCNRHISDKIFTLFVLLILISLACSLTPPKILYGGWRPILPGHPFHFGPARRKHYDQTSYENQIHFPSHIQRPLEQYNLPLNQYEPVKNVEHQVSTNYYHSPSQTHSQGYFQQYQSQDNKHAYDSANQYQPQNEVENNVVSNQYQDQITEPRDQYQNAGGVSLHVPTNHQFHSNSVSDHVHQQQLDYATHQNQGHHEQPPGAYHYQSPPYQDHPTIKQQLINPTTHQNHGHLEQPDGAYHYQSPPYQDHPTIKQQLINPTTHQNHGHFEQPAGAYHYQSPPYQDHPTIKQQLIKPTTHQNHGHLEQLPDGFQYQLPPYQDQPEVKQQQISPIKHSKNIFQYYPPQSSYDGPPKHENLDYKPVYIEVPRKPLDIFENTRQPVPYILPSLEEIPLKNFEGINQGEKAYLKITPIGKVDPHIVKEIGSIHLDKMHLLPNVFKDKKFPLILDSSGGAPKRKPELYPQLLKNQHTNIDFHHPTTDSELYDLSHLSNHHAINNFKGTEFKPDIYSSSKHPQNNKYALNSADVLHLDSEAFAPNQDLFTDIKYLSNLKPKGKPFEVTKNILSPIGKNIASQMKKFIVPKVQNYIPTQPFHSLGSQKAIFHPVGLNLNKFTKNTGTMALNALKKSLMPKVLTNYLDKNIKLGKIYKDPTMITSIHGVPAVVDREVAIVHVPITKHSEFLHQVQNHPQGNDLLYLTASTPQSTQIRFQNVTQDQPFVLLNHNSQHIVGNGTSSANQFSLESAAFVDGNSNSAGSFANVKPYGQFQYIFVGTDGINSKDIASTQPYSPQSFESNNVHPHKTPELKKQFFHAYYAPGDHVPPKGYVKMTTEEFNKLFKNAEIRYVDKDPNNLISNQKSN